MAEARVLKESLTIPDPNSLEAEGRVCFRRSSE